MSNICKEKKDAREEKKKDVELCMQDDGTVVIFADLQKVLLCPSLNASATYYKTKLCNYNYMVYDKKTHNVVCYIWNETASDLTSNTFACLLYNYLSTDERCLDATTIIVYTDGCTYQNRCTQLSNALLFYANKFNKIVYQKYLVRGHTQMEVDSCHALIEHTIRKKDIYTPACYIPMIETAKKKKKPCYKVHYLDHTFFTDFSVINYVTSIRPGRTSCDTKVVDISQLQYNHAGLSYKLEHRADEWTPLPQRLKEVDLTITLQKLNTDPLPITQNKWKDLQALKAVIPSDFHSFYDQLPKK